MSKVNVKIGYQDQEEYYSSDFFKGVNTTIDDENNVEGVSHIYGEASDQHRAKLITSMIDHLIEESKFREWTIAYIIEHMGDYSDDLMESLKIQDEEE